MNLIPTSIALAGAAAAIGTMALILLHRLRVRPVHQVVATTQFWTVAAGSMQPRSLFHRFSRWLTFVLLLGILLLLSCALIPALGAARQSQSVTIVLDTGYSMSARNADGQSRLEEAIAQIQSDVGASSIDNMTLIDASASPRIVAQGSSAMVLSDIEQFQIAGTPSNPSAALRLAFNAMRDPGGQVFHYTDRAVPADSLPEEWKNRLATRLIGNQVPNAAIVNVLAMPSAIGGPSGSIVVRVVLWDIASSQLSVEMKDVGGLTVARRAIVDAEAGEGTASFEDVVWDGRPVVVQLVGDSGIDADNTAAVVLPRRRVISFQQDGSLPAELRAALGVIGRFDVTNQTSVIRVGESVEESASTPAIRIIREGTTRVAAEQRITARADSLTADLEVEQATVGEGTAIDVNEEGIVPLLIAGENVVAAIDRSGHSPALLLSDSLFAEGATIVNRPAFFLLLQRACDELAGSTPTPRTVSLYRSMIDPTYKAAGVPEIRIAGDRSTSDPTAAPRDESTIELMSGSATVMIPLATAALILAFLITLVDGLLIAKRRIV